MTAESEPTEAIETPKPRASRGILIAAILAGSLGGSAAGAFAIAPMLAPAPASAATAVASEAEDHGAEGDHGASAATPPIVLNNLVLNPADSRGTRFLLVSVGLQLSPELTAEAFVSRETEVRDRILQVLSTKTIDELVDVTRRNGFRTELAATLDSLLGAHQVRGVFFPQFVIQ